MSGTFCFGRLPRPRLFNENEPAMGANESVVNNVNVSNRESALQTRNDSMALDSNLWR